MHPTQSGSLPGGTILAGTREYPGPLRHIEDPPGRIFVVGEGERSFALSGLAVAVVGARDASRRGCEIAHMLGYGLAARGLVVVSGLAAGIDGAAHAGALEAGGTTVAVVAGGTDVVYPARHRALRRRILESGVIVGEWPPGTPPRPHQFLRRNRIISGLCLGVVVVEARRRSGALSTARWALSQGREVFAVPGEVGDHRSEGPHQLLREGACLVETVEDVLAELPPGLARPVPPRSAPAAGSLLSALVEGGSTVDQLAQRTGRTTSEVLAGLLDLEVQGHVRKGPCGRYLPRPGL
jgi:DNA processing protein